MCVGINEQSSLNIVTNNNKKKRNINIYIYKIIQQKKKNTMNSLFFPRFSSQDILLLLFVVFKYIVDCIHRLHVVFQFPRLFGNTFLGVSRRRRHASRVPKLHKNKI